MIPLTTKLPAICSLLRRVLEMEETTRDEEWNKVCMLFLGNPQTAWDAFNKGFRAGRNITKPQATALLGDIERWRAHSLADPSIMKETEMTIIVSALTPELREILTSAVKWLERIDNRKEMLPASFLDGCDPAPLAKTIRKLLRPVSSQSAGVPDASEEDKG